ncbi:hypothetical protein CEJ65_20325, partial [Acinetobacter baumannii]
VIDLAHPDLGGRPDGRRRRVGPEFDAHETAVGEAFGQRPGVGDAGAPDGERGGAAGRVGVAHEPGELVEGRGRRFKLHPGRDDRPRGARIAVHLDHA